VTRCEHHHIFYIRGDNDRTLILSGASQTAGFISTAKEPCPPTESESCSVIAAHQNSFVLDVDSSVAVSLKHLGARCCLRSYLQATERRGEDIRPNAAGIGLVVRRPGLQGKVKQNDKEKFSLSLSLSLVL